MKQVIFAAFLAFLFGSQAYAYSNDTGYYDGLEFVAETAIPDGPSNSMSLCYATRDFKILGLTMVSDVQGYVLSGDGCNTIARGFTEEQMITAQSLELVPADLPARARNSLERNVRNYGLWVAIGLSLIAVIIRRIKSLLGYDLRAPLRSKASSRILMAMCHAGSASGVMASGELAVVNNAARRLTRRNYQTSDVVRVADHLDPNLLPEDYIDLGKGLRDREKDTMMQGVLYVAMASGRMQNGQYHFATNLAHGLGMPAEDFRRVLSTAMDDLEKYPATL
ncbi:TerB family tellurite resistance protein [Yoonia sp. BS5-3]|uniref:TerB family tellurite resistance protein n=1 Tax=Yoonia phaeophyticola TaxID=3137369 RepID=A0ABZ2V3A9_9RHOB